MNKRRNTILLYYVISPVKFSKTVLTKQYIEETLKIYGIGNFLLINALRVIF